MPKHGTVREDGKIYLRTRLGKQIWGTQEDWDNAQSWRRQYNLKKMLEHRSKDKKWKIGEFNSENGLYYLRASGNYTPMWGTLEQVQKLREQKRAMKLAYKEKMRPVKAENIQNNPKRRRGDFDPILNLYFYKRNCLTGVEIWYPKEKFQHYINMDKQTRKRNAKRRNSAPD